MLGLVASPQTPADTAVLSPPAEIASSPTHSQPLNTPQRPSEYTTPETESSITTDPVVVKDEQLNSATPSDLDALTDSTRTSPEDCCKTDDSVVSDVFERAGSIGSSDRTESEAGYRTAPNTPVLPKHLTVVTSEVLIDSPEPSQPVIESPESAVDYNDRATDPEDLVVNTLDTAKDPPADPPDSIGSLGADLDFPSADGEGTSDDESENTKSLEAPTNHEHTSDGCASEEEKCPSEVEKCTRQGNDMCEEMSHGELYDIAEEETSEEEEEPSEQEEEDEEEDDEEEDSGNGTQPTIEDEYPEEIVKKNLVNTEAQLGDLTARLCARELESNKLMCQIDDLQRDVMVKTGGMDRLQAELSAAHKESEFVRKRLRKLEEELDMFKQKNTELTEELQKRSGELNSSDSTEGFDFNRLLELEQQVKELTVKVKELEEQLENVKQERDRLETQAKEMEAEREEERRIVQEALDEAMAEKEAIQERFEKDFEKLRTVNTDREQQLLDDFEWKLREVEQACKKRLDEKEKYAKQRIKAAEDKLKAAEEDLAQLEALKQYEAEANQLRGLNLEQQRALRIAERTKEELQVSEKVLHEEVKKLKGLLDKEKAALTTMQAIHNREIDEKERKMNFRLEQQKTYLNNQWEEKLRKETIRLKVELDQINREEKKMVLEAARVEKEGELLKAKEKWEKRFQDLLKEIEALKQKLADKAEQHKQNVETVRTNADRDIFELRRKLDRIDLSYQEKIEKIQNEHEREKERLVEESERKLQSCEQNWQLQMGSTRTTLELVKEQLKREADDRVQELHDNHLRQLEEQWEQLMQERDEAIATMEENHRISTEKLRTELEAAYKCRNSREQELVDLVTRLREEICGKTVLVGDLSTQAESLKGNIEELNQQLTGHDEQFQQTKEEAEKKLRLMEDSHKQACLELTTSHKQELEQWKASVEQLQSRVAELTKQLDESKDSRLVEDLRKALSEKEHQVATLSKEKHLYQLEVMNRNSQGETVMARQRRKGSRGKVNKPGPSRGQHK